MSVIAVRLITCVLCLCLAAIKETCDWFTANFSVATPVNWKSGEDVIIVPSISDDEAKKKFPGGWKALKPYLRIVPQPKN